MCKAVVKQTGQIPFYRPTSSRALKGNAEIALILCFNWHVCCPYQTSLPLPAFFIRSYKYFNDYFAISFPFDTVGWATGRASGPVKIFVWFVGGEDLTGTVHVL